MLLTFMPETGGVRDRARHKAASSKPSSSMLHLRLIKFGRLCQARVRQEVVSVPSPCPYPPQPLLITKVIYCHPPST